MKNYHQYVELLQSHLDEYNNYKTMNLSLDMSRGKPCKEQLDLSNNLYDTIKPQLDSFNGVDYRNYGQVDGATETKEFFSNLCNIDINEIIVLGNSSLNLMYDTLQRAMQFGVLDNTPFNKQEKLRWLCPVPGYDRHFAITELFGFEMINIPMNADGPDMDIIEKLVAEDESIKGIWCVPKYSNPEGIVYSDTVVKRFANLQPRAKDFRIYWDNAYMIHGLEEDMPLLNILHEAKKANNQDMVYIFGSTSKITFASAGISFMAASKNNIDNIRQLLSVQTIGPNKLNQFAHILFLKDKATLTKHMEKHADIIRPKFEVVYKILEEELNGYIDWSKPVGGYFISCNLEKGTAKRTVELAKNIGVIFTPAGATFPYKKDPNDSNIRIAPTYPPIDELELAMKVFACCVKIAYFEKKINK